MSGPRYRPPRLSSILGGILLALLLMISMCMLGSVVKAVGSVVFCVPARLGVVSQVKAPEVVTLDMQGSPSVLSFSRPGRFHAYTSDLDLLSSAALLGDSGAGAWLVVRSVRSGEEVPVRFVSRGVRLYDSHYAPGRPIFEFAVPLAGEYVLTYPARKAALAIVPDYTTGQEVRLALVGLGELALVGGIVLLLLRWRSGKRRAARRMQP